MRGRGNHSRAGAFPHLTSYSRSDTEVPCLISCAALQDAVVLARHLRDAWPSQSQQGESLSSSQRATVAQALRAFEGERRKRVLPITLRSHAIGAAGQIGLPLVRPLLAELSLLSEPLPGRVLPITLRSHATGAAGQIGFPLVRPLLACFICFPSCPGCCFLNSLTVRLLYCLLLDLASSAGMQTTRKQLHAGLEACQPACLWH